MYQTSATPTLFITGSASISVQSSVASTSYVALGSAKSIKMSESFDIDDYEVGSLDVTHSIRNQGVTVEADIYEINAERLNKIRGEIDTWNSSHTITSGGLFVVSPRTWVLTNTGPTSSQSITITIYSGIQTEPIKIDFMGDDATDISYTALKVRGYIVSTRTAGDQLYSIVDTRST